MFFDGDETLAVLIASPSDLDDLIPMLLAYQIEWNKLHRLLSAPGMARNTSQALLDGSAAGLDAFLGLAHEDQGRLRAVWGDGLAGWLREVARSRKRLAVRMLGGSLMDYQRATLRSGGGISSAACPRSTCTSGQSIL